jgi:hypothetical protein
MEHFAPKTPTSSQETSKKIQKRGKRQQVHNQRPKNPETDARDPNAAGLPLTQIEYRFQAIFDEKYTKNRCKTFTIFFQYAVFLFLYRIKRLESVYVILQNRCFYCKFFIKFRNCKPFRVTILEYF